MAESSTATIDIDASANELYDIVTDLEAYPEWVKGMQSVEVLERDDEGRPLRCEQVVDVGVRTLRYTLAYRHDEPARLSWVSEPGGDVRLIEGSYTFEMNDDGGTTVHYALSIDPGFPAPGFMIRKATKAIMSAALDGLKTRAES